MRVALWHARCVQIFVDDEGYLHWIAANESRYVVNTRRRPSPDYIRLHAATHGVGWTTTYLKVCGRRRELETWARTVGGRVDPCTRCL